MNNFKSNIRWTKKSVEDNNFKLTVLIMRIERKEVLCCFRCVGNAFISFAKVWMSLLCLYFFRATSLIRKPSKTWTRFFWIQIQIKQLLIVIQIHDHFCAQLDSLFEFFFVLLASCGKQQNWMKETSAFAAVINAAESSIHSTTSAIFSTSDSVEVPWASSSLSSLACFAGITDRSLATFGRRAYINFW